MRISVITATRDRPQHISRLVRALMEGEHPDFEHLLVDQSTDARSREFLADLAQGDRRFRYLHLPGPGKSRALNLAVRQSTAPILALTDDDCEPRPNWLAAIVRLFSETSADIVCGMVSDVPHDPKAGYVPALDPGPTRILHGDWCSLRELGAGANMAVRRTTFEKVGLFDEMVGPGAVIPSGDDRDFLYRALRKGCTILLTRDVDVRHHGFRAYGRESYEHGRRSSIGLAVTYTKYMRQRDLPAFCRYTTDFLYDAWVAAGRVARRQYPLGINRLRYLVAGLGYGMRYPLDPATMLFRAQSEPPARPPG